MRRPVQRRESPMLIPTPPAPRSRLRPLSRSRSVWALAGELANRVAAARAAATVWTRREVTAWGSGWLSTPEYGSTIPRFQGHQLSFRGEQGAPRAAPLGMTAAAPLGMTPYRTI